MISAYTPWAAPSGAFTFVNQRRADYLGLPKGHPLAALERRSSGMPARDRWRVRVLRDGCVTPNLAVARAEGSRAEDQESLSFAGFEAFLTGRCLSVRHWPHLAGLASACAREKSVALNWTGNCVTCDRGTAQDSAQVGPDPRVRGQRSTRR
jgi:hypothetical protein